MIKDGRLTQESKKEIIDDLKTTHFHSRLKCFSDHYGLRKGELHAIVGPKGGGKSTFIKTILLDLIASRKKIFLQLSEESVQKYVLILHNIFEKTLGSGDKANEVMKNLHIESELEMDLKLKNPTAYFKRLDALMHEGLYDVFLFDNFTTSFLSNTGKFEIESNAGNMFKALADKFSIPVLVVYHTAKTARVNEKLLDADDVRGSANAVNISSYTYLVTTFFNEKPTRAFITVDKARYHQKSNKARYEMNYDTELGVFTGDMVSSYEIMQNIVNRYKKGGKDEKPIQKTFGNKVQKLANFRDPDGF